MTSGVRRQSVRSRRRWRMISCPAAKQIRWVNPSMATVSPSRTSSATASRIVATFDPASGMGGLRRGGLDAELVALGVALDEEVHDRPSGAFGDVRAGLVLAGGGVGLSLGHLPAGSFED